MCSVAAATERPSAAAVAGREREGKEEGTVWGMVTMAMGLLRAGRNTGRITGRNE